MSFDTTEIPAIEIAKDCNKLLRNRQRCIAAGSAMMETKRRLLTKYTLTELRAALGYARFNALAAMCTATETHLETLDPTSAE